MIFSDALTLDAKRRNADGYLAVRARAAKTGVYQYSGLEIDPTNEHGLRDQALVNVLRDEETVFDKSAVATFIGKPITDDHPHEPVNAANWRQHGRGVVMGALRDGDHLAFDLLLMDGPTIEKVEAGKRQLSNGYQASIQFGDFTAPDGTKCQARQASIRNGNHVAVVDRARGGDTCAIGDVATCDSIPLPTNLFDIQEKPVKNMLIDGFTVDIANAETAEKTITTLIAARDAAVAANAQKDRDLAAKDTELADLRSKATDQATIDALADAKAEVVARGKVILGDAMPDMKGKTVAEVRRAVVLAATKDASLADKSDDYIEARFDGLKDASFDLKVVPIGQPVSVGDAAQREAAALSKANDHNAWRTAGQAAA